MDMTTAEIMDYIHLYYTSGVRWVFVGLAAFILLHQILSLLKMRNPSEIWAYLRCPDGSSVPLTHWENLIGRARGSDIILNISSVSRSHATLIRDSQGVWTYEDLGSKNGSLINGVRVTEPTVLKGGDKLTIGGQNFELYPVSLQERLDNIEKRKIWTRSVSPWPSLVALTIFQLLTVFQFHAALEDDFSAQIPITFGLLCALMWAYVITLRIFRRKSFEIEIIAFFLTTLSLAVTTTALPGTELKQCICVVMGVVLFFALCWLLRDLNRTKKLIYIVLGLAVLLLLLNLAIGAVKNGSQNWIEIAGISVQPSEIVKIAFIYVGAATLDELQKRRNLLIFMAFSVFCLGCLALMGDFGTAIIFFVTFLIISFLRSGDFTKLFLIIGAAGLMGLMVLRFKPYVAHRFDVWGHVWEDPTGAGFQQVQTLTSIASGGLPGLGAGEGNLGDVAASSTDLVFGLLCEEWGLIIAVLAVLCIVTLGIFAFKCIAAGRSTYYSIAACSAMSLYTFQTILNVFGSVDLLPLTGVTFPFVSSGGTSMIATWGLLAFLKATDTRQNASFAIRLDKKGDFADYQDQLSAGDMQTPEDLFNMVDGPEAVARRRREKAELEREKKAAKAAARQAESFGDQLAREEEMFEYRKARRQESSQKRQPAPRRSSPVDTQVIPKAGSSAKSRPAASKPKAAAKAKPKPAKPAQPKPVKAAPAKSAPQKPTKSKPAQQQRPMKKDHPRSVNYRSVTDDDFFNLFDENAGRKAPGGSAKKSGAPAKKPQADEPLTLEDLFGGNKK